jgi:glycosyltransferase involved in cell wall biosynthesis
MRVALIAPPFINVPPSRYGGTELFVGHLAEGLVAAGHVPVVYAVRSSTVGCEVRGWYDQPDWPPTSDEAARLKHHVHTTRAMHDAARDTFDVIHVQDAMAVPLSVFAAAPMVCTVHHPHEPVLSRLYQQYPDIHYVCISRFQHAQERLPRVRTIHHGIRVDQYELVRDKQPYLSFLGRIAPMKGAHLAIAVARLTGIPLKLAGEIQPLFRDYWESEVRPHVDGKFIQYLGEADHRLKNELLGHSTACLFPIQWNEPFGLVMIEAMACGTPVLALHGGAVEEVVEDGVTGWICNSVSELAAKALAPSLSPDSCRRRVEERFSVDRMVADYVSVYVEAIAVTGRAVERV